MKRMRSKGFVWRRWIPDQIAQYRPPQPQTMAIEKTKVSPSSNQKVNQKHISSALSSETIDLEIRENNSISSISSSSSSSSFFPTSTEVE